MSSESNEQILAVYQESRIPVFVMQAPHIERLRRELPHYNIIWCRSQEEFLSALPRADTVLTLRFKQEWFSLAPRLRRIGTPAAGRDFFSITAKPSHVSIKNGTFHGAIMAESALGMILAFNRGILTAYKHQLAGDLWPNQQLFGSRLIDGTHAVILGFGHIGVHIGERLKAFGVRITGIKRELSDAVPAWFDDGDTVLPVERLHDALADADHVVAVLPSDTGTTGLIGRAEFEIMPRHAVFYNLGRGNCVDETALADALRGGVIAGACLDVFAQEPLCADSPLADGSLPGLLRMPHATAFCECYLDRYLDEFITWIKSDFNYENDRTSLLC